MLKIDLLADKLFKKEDQEKVDEYISKLFEGLHSTNKKFNLLISLLLVSISAHFLFSLGISENISFMGFSISDKKLIDIWYLLIPSVIFLTTTIVGYMRVYQQGLLTELYYRFREEEFHTESFRLFFPTTIASALDLLRRQNDFISKAAALFPSIFFALGSILLPIGYIANGYLTAFNTYGYSTELIISVSLSALLIFHGMVILKLSMKL